MGAIPAIIAEASQSGISRTTTFKRRRSMSDLLRTNAGTAEVTLRLPLVPNVGCKTLKFVPFILSGEVSGKAGGIVKNCEEKRR
jgi:hypothetical protein